MAVVLPAPFGPIRPTMRPLCTLKSTLSRARRSPNVRVRPRASITAVIVGLRFVRMIRGRGLRGGHVGQQLAGVEAQPRNRGDHFRPLVLEEFLAFVLEQ